SSPAMMNFGDHNYDKSLDPDAVTAVGGNKFVTYKEGIYVGYKYYETRYEDCILGQGKADSTAGTYNSTAGWNYAEEVCYPFGFGLSYTTFEYKLDDFSYDAARDMFIVKASVTNTGKVDGKASVQVYAQSPYTDYDKENLVEKASVQLMNYDKVFVKAGETVSTTIELNRYFLAAYDAKKAKGYIFEPGDYYFGIGNGAHEALNAILAVKGAKGLYDHNGDPVDAEKAKTCAVKWTPSITAVDTETYKMSPYNPEVQVTNLFDDCDINYWVDDKDKVVYLTRNDWEGTYPTTQEGVYVNERMLKGLKMDNYVKPADSPSVADVPHGVRLENKISFIDMKDVPFDDPKWDTFMSQLSLEDLAISVSDFRGISAVVSINKPASTVAEGPEGMLATFNFGDKRHTTGFATLPLVAASWSHEIQKKHGHLYGEEALFAGVAMVNGPGANLVRTPYGGRTSEYFSEDGILNYYTAANVVGGMLERGLIGNLKHCFMNNQETNRQQVSTFATEQAMREIYARAWEGAFTLGHGMGVMTAYNRIGLTYTASSVALNDTLFRKEWNFQGSIIDDAMAQSTYSNAGDMLEAGTNLFCLDGARGGIIVQQIKDNDDGHLLQLLQRANKRLFYALLHSSMGGIAEDYVETDAANWWETTLNVIDVVTGLLALFFLGLYFFTEYGKKDEKVTQA
ncbi:MAG: fibronectin type III-like domain-contianing protein, partial [Lachnospiraceae bacterium]|nr:fibronectin type III-like domain-contianing protein [Lachnospiraceae bacterium]